jgi:hypothetical protein
MFRPMKEQLWFSTAVNLKIDGVTYRPSICYPVPPLAQTSLEAFVKQGKVKFYNKPVKFANGIAIEIPDAIPAAVMPQPVLVTDKTLKKGSGKGSKGTDVDKSKWDF